MPSFTNGDALGVLKQRWLFVSFSVNNSVGSPAQCIRHSPSSWCDASTATVPFAACAALRSFGLGVGLAHDHVLRNHSVGNRCSRAARSPRFVTLIWTSTSSGEFFAYSTTTSQ